MTQMAKPMIDFSSILEGRDADCDVKVTENRLVSNHCSVDDRIVRRERSNILMADVTIEPARAQKKTR